MPNVYKHIIGKTLIELKVGRPGADPGFLKRGVHLRSTSKGGGGGPTLGPMLKGLHRGPKVGVGGGGGSGPPAPPPWIRY